MSLGDGSVRIFRTMCSIIFVGGLSDCVLLITNEVPAQSD